MDYKDCLTKEMLTFNVRQALGNLNIVKEYFQNPPEAFNEIYNRMRNRFPREMEISRNAFRYFYNGINYPTLLPHKEEEYQRKFIDSNHKKIFNDYLDCQED